MPFMFDKKSSIKLDKFMFNEASSSRKVAPKFNPILEFFEVLEKGYQGIRVDKMRSLQDFQRKTGESLRESYSRMKCLIAATGGVTEAQAIQF